MYYDIVQNSRNIFRNWRLSLDKSYFQIVQKFLEELNVMVETQNADKEIIKYLKSLT